MAAGALESPQQRVFRIFISYASEDLCIANAIATCFKAALPDFFAEVNIDKKFLEPGSAFQTQIEAKLQETDIFILVYTGVEKRSHSFTGWEVGYFDRILRTDPRRRKKIAIYLYSPPATTASDEGISLNLSKEQLHMTAQEFEAALEVSDEDPLCKEIESWQMEVDRNIVATGFDRPHRKAEQEPATCVRSLKLAIFQYLKSTTETVVKPQRQIAIRVKSSSLEQASDSLPPDAVMRPMGSPANGGSMSIFGLADSEITWKDFLDATSSQSFAESWRDAISIVVLSAFPDRVDVDNSQIIIGADGRTGYRIILTSSTKFYDDFREYNLYFVEMLRRADFGDEDTTNLLKGLELACRFRSMYLEPESDFLADNIELTPYARLPQIAGSLLRELNLMHRDAQEQGLDHPGRWARYVDFSHMRTIAEAYRPCDAALRSLIPQVLAAKGDAKALEQLRKQMTEALRQMETAVRPENALLLKEMAAVLTRIVDSQDKKKSGADGV